MTTAVSLARRVRMLCDMERRARARGEPRRTMARRCARLVLQGVLDEAEAADALALVLAGRAAPDTPDAVAACLRVAAHLLRQAMQEEEQFRERVAREIVRAAREAMERWAPAAAVLDAARTANEEAGRPYVWPELHRLVQGAAARFLRQQQGVRGGGHG